MADREEVVPVRALTPRELAATRGLNPPNIRAPEVAGPEAGWPPKLKNVTALKAVALRRHLSDADRQSRADLLSTATKDPRVRGLLGHRFTLVDISEVGPDKDPRVDGAATYRVLFFSYTANCAVQVLIDGHEVTSAIRKYGYHPPESQEEIAKAIELARAHPELHEAAANLIGEALLAEPHSGTPQSALRVLYVCFVPGEGAAPHHAARVDLTNSRVLDVRHFVH